MNSSIKFSPKYTFGVEVEVDEQVPLEHIYEKLSGLTKKKLVYLKKSYAKSSNKDAWYVKFDRSCGTANDQIGGGEITSYVGKRVIDINRISETINSLSELNLKTNQNCSLHVHIGSSKFTNSQLSRLLWNWFLFEPVILQAIPNYRRDGYYCKSLRKVVGNQTVSFHKFLAIIGDASNFDSARRRTVNIVNHINQKNNANKTIEFRMAESSLLEADIKNWLVFYIYLSSVFSEIEYNDNFVSDFDEKQSFDLLDLINCLNLAGKNSKINVIKSLMGSPKISLSNNDGNTSKLVKDMKYWLLNRIIKYSSVSLLADQAVLLKEMKE